MTIYKYTLVERIGDLDFKCPDPFCKYFEMAGTPLDAGVVGDGLFAWASVDPTATPKRVSFLICSTGQRVDLSGWKFLRTSSWSGKIFHVFWRAGS